MALLPFTLTCFKISMQQHRCFANFTGIAACVPKEGHPNGVYILDDKEKGAGGCPSDKPRCAPKDGIGGNVLWDDWDCIKDSVPTFPPEDKCGKDQKIYVDVQEGLILT